MPNLERKINNNKKAGREREKQLKKSGVEKQLKKKKGGKEGKKRLLCFPQ